MNVDGNYGRYTNNRQITDASGKFYAGMTAEEAKQNKTYKKTFRRDFQNLDTNSDSVLSVDEILAERRRSAKNNKAWAAGFGIWGIMDCLPGLRAGGKWWYADLIIDAVCIILELREAKRTEEGTKHIEEMLAANENGHFSQSA